MKAKEFDRKFDAGEDVTEYLDLSEVRRSAREQKQKQKQKRVSVDTPLSVSESPGRDDHSNSNGD